MTEPAPVLMRPLEKKSVLISSGVIFSLIVAAKFLNFFKKILIGKLFGVSWVADAFFASSYFPYYISIFFEGVLFLGFLPVFARKISSEHPEKADATAKSFFWLLLGLTVIIASFAWFQAPWLMKELVPGFTDEKRQLAIGLFRIQCWIIVFLPMATFFQSLNSYFGHHGRAASSGLTDALVMVSILLAGWRSGGIYAAAWASVISAAAAMLLQLYFLNKRYLLFANVTSRVRSEDLRAFAGFVIPLALVWCLQQIPLLIFNRFGSGMWQGTISALNISLAIASVPMGLVSYTVLIAIYPSLARQVQTHAEQPASGTFFATLRAACLILIPAGFFLTGFAEPLVKIFFSANGISHEGVRRIIHTLVVFGWSGFLLYADLFMMQSLIAARKMTRVMMLMATRALLSYGFSYFFSSWWDYTGIAAAFSAALAVNFLLFPIFFRGTLLDGPWKNLYGYCFRLILAASPFLLLPWILPHILYGFTGPGWVSVFRTLAASIAASVCYILLLFSFRIPEWQGILSKLPGSRVSGKQVVPL